MLLEYTLNTLLTAVFSSGICQCGHNKYTVAQAWVLCCSLHVFVHFKQQACQRETMVRTWSLNSVITPGSFSSVCAKHCVNLFSFKLNATIGMQL